MNIDTFHNKEFLNMFFGIFFLVLIFHGTRLNAQVQQADDPNLDQIPRYLRENPPVNDNVPLSSVITVDNWDNYNLGVDFAENNIAASLQNPAWHFVAYNINAAHHTENGRDWANVVPDFGVTLNGDPVVAYDSLGNLFYINLYPYGTIEGVKVIESSDNGATWGSAVTGAPGNDKCWIACDQTNGPYANYVYVCMTNISQGSFARSTDHGATFTTTFTPGTQTLPGMSVCVGANNNIQGGAVYCVTNSGSAFNSIYTFYRSLDGGATFSLMSSRQFSNTVGTQNNNRNSVEGMRTRPYPYIAADNSYGPHRGRLYNVYASNDPPGDGNKPDVWLRYSDDGGATFSNAIRVNDDINTQNNHQWHPAVWCDKQTGRLYLNWMDTRDTPTSDSAYIYATYSDDGGTTFVPNQKISNKKMKINCSSCGGAGTPRYQGDYNGIVSNMKGSVSGWTDFRNGSFMSTTGYFPDFAMAIDHNSDTLHIGADSIDFIVSIPEVRLYADTVLLSGEMIPVPVGGTVAFSYPQGNRITTYPDSRIVRLKSSETIMAGSYQAVFSATGPNGTPAHKRVAIIHSPGLILYVSATPPSVCQGATTQLLVEAGGGTSPYTYSWTSNPPGFTSGIANPTASPFVNTWYKVTVTDNASHIGIDSVLVTIDAVPETPGLINGPAEICKNSLATYSVIAIIGATSYSWMVPAGAIITTGQNTPVISVQWGDTSGTVSVIAGNFCGNSNPSVLAVTIYDIPPVPGTITGADTLCQNETTDFSVDTVTGATSYFWSVPPGALILSGQGSKTVSVQWGENTGDITVIAQNDCGNSQQVSKAIQVEKVPLPAGNITGKDTVCKDQNGYHYSVAEIAGVTTYIWSVPAGATINGNANQKEITVDFSVSAVSGPITVKGQNACGEGTENSKTVTVNSCSGIQENDPDGNVSIYPNPTEGLLNVAIKNQVKQLKLILTDVNGREVYIETVQNTQPGLIVKLDVSGFTRGFYFIKLISDDQLYTEKVVIQ